MVSVSVPQRLGNPLRPIEDRHLPSAVGRMARWWCRVPRCGAQGDGTVVDWRKHYVDTHMTP